ncbi:hypothetical protein EJ06DRAFT_78613, partial [Trichodelitschia bisporula]
ASSFNYSTRPTARETRTYPDPLHKHIAYREARSRNPWYQEPSRCPFPGHPSTNKTIIHKRHAPITISQCLYKHHIVHINQTHPISNPLELNKAPRPPRKANHKLIISRARINAMPLPLSDINIQRRERRLSHPMLMPQQQRPRNLKPIRARPRRDLELKLLHIQILAQRLRSHRAARPRRLLRRILPIARSIRRLIPAIRVRRRGSSMITRLLALAQRIRQRLWALEALPRRSRLGMLERGRGRRHRHGRRRRRGRRHRRGCRCRRHIPHRRRRQRPNPLLDIIMTIHDRALARALLALLLLRRAKDKFSLTLRAWRPTPAALHNTIRIRATTASAGHERHRRRCSTRRRRRACCAQGCGERVRWFGWEGRRERGLGRTATGALEGRACAAERGVDEATRRGRGGTGGEEGCCFALAGPGALGTAGAALRGCWIRVLGRVCCGPLRLGGGRGGRVVEGFAGGLVAGGEGVCAGGEGVGAGG